MIETEQLVKLVERLHQADFQVGARECIAAQNLIIALAASGRLPDNPDDLRDKLAPIFCSTPEEQETFHRHFRNWLKAAQLEAKPQPPTLTTEMKAKGKEAEDKKPEPKSFWRAKRSRWIPSVAGALVLTLAVTIYALYLRPPSEIPEIPAVWSVFGQVVDDEHTPLKGASITVQNQPPVITDEYGNFAFSSEPAEAPPVIEISRPDYQSVRLDLNQIKDEFLYVHLQALPTKDSVIVPPMISTEPTPTPDYTSSTIIASGRQSEWKTVYIGNFIFLLVAIGVLPLLVFGVWWVIRSYRHRSQLEKWRASKKPQMDQLVVRGATEQLYRGANFRRTIQELRRHRPFAFNDLDIPLTVEATIRNGGWFKPAYSPRKLTPEYLALVDRASFCDQWARQADELIGRLKRDGVYVSRYYFNSDPRTCRRDDPTAPHLTLQDLAGLHPDYHLLIFSDASGLFSSINGRPEFLRLFEPWRQRAVLTPIAIENWGFRESSLSGSEFVVVPASKDGMAALAEAISASAAPDMRSDGAIQREFPEMLRERPRRWLEGTEPLPAEVNKLRFQLRLYLGADGYYLLGACAVYPALSWDLTIYLAYRLLGPDQLEKTLLSLWRLPWLRHEVMPDWLRTRLIADLSPEQEQNVRRALDNLLISYLENPREGFHLEVAPRQKEEHVSFWKKAYRGFVEKARHRKSKMLVRQFIKDEPENPLAEYVFLNFISGRRPGKLGVSIPARLRERLSHLLYPEGRSVFGLRPVAALSIAVVVSLVALTATVYMLPATDFGAVSFKMPPLPFPAPVPPASGYSITPGSGAQGGSYEVLISASDCSKVDLSGATLKAPDGTGVIVAKTNPSACQLQATLVVNSNAPPGTIPLTITKGTEEKGSVNFTVTRSGACPRLIIIPTQVRPDGLGGSLTVRVEDGQYANLTYEWSVSGGAVNFTGQGTPTINFVINPPLGGSSVATVKVGGLDAGCGNTATYRITNTSTFAIKVYAERIVGVTVCPSDPSRNNPPNSRIRVGAGTNTWPGPDPSVKRYTWSSTGGRIIGSGMMVALDLTGVGPGNYTVTAQAERTDGIVATATSGNISVVGCTTPPPTPCPSLTVSCSSEVDFDKTINFSAKIVGNADPSNFKFDWKVSDGTIVTGQGTPTITVDKTSRGGTTTATVNVGGLAPGCTTQASCSTSVAPGPRVLPDLSSLDDNTLNVIVRGKALSVGAMVRVEVQTKPVGAVVGYAPEVRYQECVKATSGTLKDCLQETKVTSDSVLFLSPGIYRFAAFWPNGKTDSKLVDVR